MMDYSQVGVVGVGRSTIAEYGQAGESQHGPRERRSLLAPFNCILPVQYIIISLQFDCQCLHFIQ